jgi:alpha-tubulin suppressor-like RCC1 family protein
MDFSQMAIGSRFAFGITSEHQLFASGNNDCGQLGLQTDISIKHFTKVNFENGKAAQVACGWAHALLLTDSGNIFVSGDGRKGQLGLGNELESSNKFIEVTEIKEKIVQISYSLWSSFALLESGKIMFWGQFRGLNCEQVSRPTLLKVIPEGYRVKKMAVGHKHLLVMTSEGNVFGFGCNKYGQIDVGSLQDEVVDIHAGWNHSVLQMKSNELILFGKNDHNQLAHPDPKARRNQLSFIKDGILQFAVGSDHALLLTEKDLLAWGWNEHGVIGQNHTIQLYGPPLKIEFDTRDIHKIFCGTASSSVTTFQKSVNEKKDD